LDAGKPALRVSRERALASQPLALRSHPFRNDDFPQTYIQQISVRMRPRVDDRARNAHRKGPTPCKAFSEALTAILARYISRGSCKAGASRFTIFQVSPRTQLPTAACAFSQ
jgi:hypothetical protein